MPTDCLFREDAYLTSTPATVLGITEKGGVVLDRTCFYATSGGQPGDSGVMVTPSAGELALATAVYSDPLKTEIAHVPAEGIAARPAVGEIVSLKIDWGARYRRMRMHTALHLLSAVLPYPVTGGAVNEDDSRLDFDIPDAGLDKDEITAKVNEMIKADAEVKSRWIADAELEANPGLVKTMSVKPPMGTGRIRLIEIVGFDLQPCGGTHVHRTGEIGAVRVTQIEKKGKQNRRVRISFA
jgi:misacylated tRNA(Ala) deacylase